MQSVLKWLSALAVAVLPASVNAWPQEFLDGPQVKGQFTRAFGLNPDRMRQVWSSNDVVAVEQITCSSPAGVVWPGEEPEFTLQITNKTGNAVDLKGRALVVQYEITTLSAEDVFDIGLKKLADCGEVPVSVSLPAHGWQNVKVRPPVPSRNGGYLMFLEIPGHDKILAAAFVRTFKPEQKQRQFFRLTLDTNEPVLLSRIGATLNRINTPYRTTTDDDFGAWYADFSVQLRNLKDHHLPACLEFGAGKFNHPNQPLGMPRPFLSKNNEIMDGGTDLAWLPSYDPDFKKFVKRLVTEWGWPKGPVNAVKLWNEPWNGGSISGWGADDERYRQIYTVMCEAVEEAEKESGVKVLVGGCDSSSNTLDKLFADGTDKFLPRLDFMSIHYQGINPNTTIKRFVNKKPNRVLVWDTESWIANSDDRVAGVLSAMCSFGQDRVVGIVSDNVIAGVRDRDILVGEGKKERRHIVQTWSVGAAVGAFQHFVGERPFRELLFKNGLPTVMCFDGENGNEEEGTVVVLGDIGSIFGHNQVALRTCRSLAEVQAKEELRRKTKELPEASPERQKLAQRIAAPMPFSGCSMTIKADPRYSLYDFYGNIVPATESQIAIPLDARGFYLRGDGKPGSHGALIAALRGAQIQGISPVAVVARDMQAEIGRNPTIQLELSNVLNRPVKAAISVSAEGLTLQAPASVEILPYQTLTLPVQVTGGAARPDNLYPMRLVLDCGPDGKVIHEENMRVNVIHHMTAQIDGNLDEWKNAIPQIINFSGKQSATLTEKAWRPYEHFDESDTQGLAAGYLAYDENNFYFAAKVSDKTHGPGMPRFADPRHWDDYFYPEVVYKKDPGKTTAHHEVHVDNSPTGKAWEPAAQRMELDLDLPQERMVSLMLADSDQPLARRVVDYTVTDRDSGKELARTRAQDAYNSLWVRMKLNGKIRIAISSPMWLRASLSALAVDPLPTEFADMAGAVLPVDKVTRDKFSGVYGKELLLLPGRAAAGDIKFAWNDHVARTEYRWPEGVSRYSYRMSPILPFNGDNLQIAFNVLPDDRKDMLPAPPGTFNGYIDYQTVDYEYALNVVADQWGGGTEIWRLAYPGMPRKHFYPRQPMSPADGPAKGARMITVYQNGTRVTECAIPWPEIPDVKVALDAGKTIKFSFKANDTDSSACLELSRERSVSRRTDNAMHPDWAEHWSVETEFSFEK